MNDRYSPSISKGPLTRLGRLLPHVPLRTGRWGDMTKVERPMGRVDPVPLALDGSFAVPELEEARVDLHLLEISQINRRSTLAWRRILASKTNN
jgi:hypothetical protein